MRCAIIENGLVKNIATAEIDFAESMGWIVSETARIGDIWDGETFITPEKPAEPPKSVTALQGLLALEERGLAQSYEDWATAPERTFVEKAFIDKAITWKRNDPVLLTGAAAIGLSSDDLDALFLSASKK